MGQGRRGQGGGGRGRGEGKGDKGEGAGAREGAREKGEGMEVRVFSIFLFVGVGGTVKTPYTTKLQRRFTDCRSSFNPLPAI